MTLSTRMYNIIGVSSNCFQKRYLRLFFTVDYFFKRRGKIDFHRQKLLSNCALKVGKLELTVNFDNVISKKCHKYVFFESYLIPVILIGCVQVYGCNCVGQKFKAIHGTFYGTTAHWLSNSTFFGDWELMPHC